MTCIYDREASVRRNDCAIAFATLMGELQTRPRAVGLDGFAYTFDTDRPHWHDTREEAAWMFLCRRGYGLDKRNDLVRLKDYINA